MAFKPQNSRLALGSAAATVRSWAIGWSVSDARPAAGTDRNPNLPQEKRLPGSYGVLVAGTPERSRR